MCPSQSRHYVRGSQHPPPPGASGVSAGGPFCGSWSVRPGRPRQRATGVRMTKQTPHTHTHTHPASSRRRGDSAAANRRRHGAGLLRSRPLEARHRGRGRGCARRRAGLLGVCGAVRPSLHVRRTGCADGSAGTTPAGHGERQRRGRVSAVRGVDAAGTKGRLLGGEGRAFQMLGHRPTTPLTGPS